MQEPVSFSFSETISLLALCVSFGALAWNIVRDFILDRIKVEFSASIGEIKQIKGSGTALFAEQGIFSDRIEAPKLILSMINNSRRHIYLQRVLGKFKTPLENNKINFSIAVAGLPKKLESYEIFSVVSELNKILLVNLVNDNIDSIWVEDTSSCKWQINSNNFTKLKEAAVQYSEQNK
jgi:hypothetical protein